jgi:hypothetical protein
LRGEPEDAKCGAITTDLFMRAETQTLIDEIKQSLALLRRHL